MPVVARDVKFTIEHLQAHAFPGLKAAFDAIERVDVVSEREVLFTYAYPVNLSAMMALGKLAMMPEHYWRERDSSKTTIEPPLASGPYRIGKFKVGLTQRIQTARFCDSRQYLTTTQWRFCL